jgi:hypothetical protein
MSRRDVERAEESVKASTVVPGSAALERSAGRRDVVAVGLRERGFRPPPNPTVAAERAAGADQSQIIAPVCDRRPSRRRSSAGGRRGAVPSPM